jgi:DNA-binding response OmpR family regulator
MTPKILVVDDDQRLQHLLARYLGEHGFRVYTASDAVELQRQIQRNVFELYLLDINLPGKNGLEICKNLRASGDVTPVIMLTARSEDVDRITGLEIGADDYLPKPFNPRELLARIHSVLRRVNQTQFIAVDSEAVRYEFNGYVFDGDKQQLTYLDKLVPLNHNEFTFLKILIQNKGQVLSRTQLCHRIYGREHTPDQRDIDMLASRLRKHLLDDKEDLNIIKTVRGIGYMFLG